MVTVYLITLKFIFSLEFLCHQISLRISKKKSPHCCELLFLVTPTGLGWNTLYESIAELDRKLEELGLEVNSND